MVTASSLRFRRARRVAVLLVLGAILWSVLLLRGSVADPSSGPTHLMPDERLLGPFRWERDAGRELAIARP